MKTFALVFTTAALFAFHSPADTPIATLPFTIAASGNYYLASNLAYSGTAGNAITINASDVTIDLQGHRLVCGAPPSNTAAGIAAVDRNDLVIRNGSILNFNCGISLTGATPQRGIVEKLNILSARQAAIWSESKGIVIRDNTICGTGSGVTSGPWIEIIGIRSRGDESRIVNNDVIDTYRPNCTGWGIVCYGGIVQGNRVTNTSQGTTGIFVLSSKLRGFALENCVSCFKVGVDGGGNVMCRRNTCYGCDQTLMGGVDGGDNL